MKKKKSSGIGVFLLVGFLLYFVYVLYDQQKVILAKEAEMNTVQAKIQEEQKLNEDLKNQKEMLTSDEYIEKVARDKLGMVKPGERIFVDINK